VGVDELPQAGQVDVDKLSVLAEPGKPTSVTTKQFDRLGDPIGQSFGICFAILALPVK
jgi:hypothetical protein